MGLEDCAHATAPDPLNKSVLADLLSHRSAN
jgi:hypothetical protein